MDDAGILLAIIAGRETSGYLELRWPVRGGMGQSWHRLGAPHALNACAREIAHLKDRADVFIGAAPRTRQEGVSDAVERVWCLWADCDSPESVAALAAFAHPPTLTIASGTPGRLHAWWALTRPAPRAAAERGLRRLAGALGGDMKVTDAARIMRPPATLNWKHRPPAKVMLATHRDVSYSLADLIGDIPDPRPPKPVQARRRPPAGDDLASVPVETYYAVLTGREPLQGNSPCPFHGEDRNPSLRLYPKTDTWYCFACEKGGGVFEFGAALWGLGTRGDDFKKLRARLTDALC